MNSWAILHIINAGFLAILMLIHLRFTKKDYQANRLFTVTLFSLAYESFIMFLFASKWILDVPHFGRTGTIALYLIYPSAYLYIRNLLQQEKLKWIDAIHLLPIALYILDFSAYFIQSAEMKRAQMQIDYTTQNLYIAQSPSLFPKYFHFRLRMFLSFIYIILSINTWLNVFLNQSKYEILKENRSILQWTITLCILLVLGVFPASIVDVFSFPIDLAAIQNLSLYVTTILFALVLFFRPDIIYGVRGLWKLEPVQANPVMVEKPAISESNQLNTEAKRVYLKEETVEKLATALQVHLLHDRAYLISNYSITDFSIAVGYPTYQVSAYLNNHLGMNFNEYINAQRIDYLLKQLSEKPEWRAFTLEALGQQVGFNNRYTFLNAFKKSTGETPSVYFKKWKAE